MQQTNKAITFSPIVVATSIAFSFFTGSAMADDFVNLQDYEVYMHGDANKPSMFRSSARDYFTAEHAAAFPASRWAFYVLAYGEETNKGTYCFARVALVPKGSKKEPQSWFNFVEGPLTFPDKGSFPAGYLAANRCVLGAVMKFKSTDIPALERTFQQK